MDELLAFQTAAKEYGFMECHECADGSALWLKKSTNITGLDTDQRVCIDRLTHSATVFCVAGGKLLSNTFRDVRELRDWLKLRSCRTVRSGYEQYPR
jgi:hypothetical protein